MIVSMLCYNWIELNGYPTWLVGYCLMKFILCICPSSFSRSIDKWQKVFLRFNIWHIRRFKTGKFDSFSNNFSLNEAKYRSTMNKDERAKPMATMTQLAQLAQSLFFLFYFIYFVSCSLSFSFFRLHFRILRD